MNTSARCGPAALMAATMAATCLLTALAANADSALVLFPSNYADWVHYGTAGSGETREELYTSAEAIAAAKNNRPFPSGTVIALADYRNGQLYRVVVMEKRSGWGAQYPDTLRNGEWEYQSFNPDGSVKTDGQPDRCMSCHKSQAAQDFVWSINRMKAMR